MVSSIERFHCIAHLYCGQVDVRAVNPAALYMRSRTNKKRSPSLLSLLSQAYQFLREVVQEYKGSPLHVRLKEKVFQRAPPPHLPPFSNLSPRGPMPFQHPHAFPYMPRPPVSMQNQSMERGRPHMTGFEYPASSVEETVGVNALYCVVCKLTNSCVRYNWFNGCEHYSTLAFH